MRPPTRETKYTPPRLPGMGSHPTELWHGCRYRPEKGSFSYVTEDGETYALAENDEAAERIARALNLLDAREDVLSTILEEAAQLAEKPYSDEVAALGRDQPLAVGEKIAKALRARAKEARGG
jgi:hypothetical protein